MARTEVDVAALCVSIKTGQRPGATDHEKRVGRQAASILIPSQLALVRWVLNRRGINQTRETVASGEFGILEAARRWDPAKGSWSGYAKLWIFKYVYADYQKRRGKEALTPDGELHGDVGDVREDFEEMSIEGLSRARVDEMYRRIGQLDPLTELGIRCRWRLHEQAQPDPVSHRVQEAEVLRAVKRWARAEFG